MFARLSAFVIWSLVAATAVFWALRLAASPAPVPPYAVAVSKSIVVRGDLTRLFGAPPRVAVAAGATPEAPARYKLLGVMAPRSKAAQAEEGRGVALIAVDGKPPRPYRVGATVADGYVLQSLEARAAALGAGAGSAPAFTLQLPTRPMAVMTPPAPLPPQN
jgi:general secretion pathway protein C